MPLRAQAAAAAAAAVSSRGHGASAEDRFDAARQPPPPPPPPPPASGSGDRDGESPTARPRTLSVEDGPADAPLAKVPGNSSDADGSEIDGAMIATAIVAANGEGNRKEAIERGVSFELRPDAAANAVDAGPAPPRPGAPEGAAAAVVSERTASSASLSHSALKANPRFSPLAAPLGTIRRAANKASVAAAGGGRSGRSSPLEVGKEPGPNATAGGGGSGGGLMATMGLGFLSGATSVASGALLNRVSGGLSESEALGSEEGGSLLGGDQIPTSVASRLNLLLSATSQRRSVPASVRSDRAARLHRAAQLQQSQAATTADASQNGGAATADDAAFPTALHRACASPDATLLQLQTELAKSPPSASVVDCLGRLPLHVLGDNAALVSTALGRATATKFALQLMKVHPEALTAPDRDGFYPFASLIGDWEQWSYRPAAASSKRGSLAMGMKTGGAATRLVGRITDAVAQAGTGISSAAEKSFQAAASSLASEHLADSPLTDREGQGLAGSGDDARPVLSSRSSFPRIELWDEVNWCFEMLSLAMDELGGKSGGLHPMENAGGASSSSDDLNERDIDARWLLAKHLPTMIPSILKTILLIDSGGDEGSARKVLLQSSLVRAILLQPESVGDWITAMIRKRGIASRFAVDYLAMVSGTTVEDYVGAFRPVLLVDKEDYQASRSAVFNAIDGLEGTIASLATLVEKETERAVSTSVIWYIMSRNLARPFVVSMSLIDFVLQIILLLAFRVRISDPAYGYSTGPRVPTNIVYLICWNYFVRKGCQLVALATVSTGVLRSYFLNFGNLTDLLAMVLVLVTYSFQEANPNTYRNGLNTLVLGLLWLRIVGFMKVVNKEMSTFIMALGQILRDLLYFMVVLVVLVVMFADMFRIAITTKDNGNFCDNYKSAQGGELNGAIGDYCEEEFYYSILRTYAVLIGDFAVDDYTATTGMIILFVIFTMVGVIIFLSVLIAVICDSYEIAKLSSQRLFGKARVSFVAQNEALESFLKPGSNPVADLNASPTKIVATGFAILRWGLLVTLVVTAMYAEVFIVTQAISSIVNRSAYFTVIFMTVLAVVLTCALWILVFFAIGGVARAVAPGIIGSVVRLLDRITDSFSKAMAFRLFGLSKAERTPFVIGKDDDEEEWQGRVAHLEQVVARTGNRIRDELKAEMLALEKRLYEHERVVAAETRTARASAAAHSDPWDSFKVPLLDHDEKDT